MSMTMDMSASSTMSGHMHDPTSTSSTSMDGMSSSHMHMSMADMMMTFFTATDTPLYSEGWTPTTTGQYVGTCIFLIVLAALFRGIVALRTNFAALLVWWTHRRETSLLRSDYDGEGKVRLGAAPNRPWNINEALARAVLDTVLAGVSYLLMLAVMTMNVGYFLSILGGTFLGSFVIGDWQPTADHCDGH